MQLPLIAPGVITLARQGAQIQKVNTGEPLFNFKELAFSKYVLFQKAGLVPTGKGHQNKAKKPSQDICFFSLRKVGFCNG